MRGILIFIFVVSAIQLNSQNSVSGTVTNEAGKALPGVTVRVSNTFIATSSDAEGNYFIRETGSRHPELEFRLIGYSPLKVRLDLEQNKSYHGVLKEQPFLADEVVILGTRADEKSGMAYTTLGKDEIAKQNFGTDIPILLSYQPSVVSTSDAGTGIGYTGIRVRGSDPTRTNVTINGIPYNDPESHGVFWVNLPDFASSVQSIQLQRGVGSSTNGAGAFGVSVNILTNDLKSNPYGAYTISAGSFNTLRHTFELGTGLVKGFTFDVRLSNIRSDGFIDRASSDLQSWFASAAWYRKKTSFKLNVFSGREKTYQAWYGVPQDSLASNRRYNPAGAYFDAAGNEQFYKNEIDFYKQSHTQFFIQHEIKNGLLLSIGLHHTLGAGYYEQYRQDKLAKYGLPDIILASLNNGVLTPDTLKKTDLIRQRWLDNQFYGGVFSLKTNPWKRLNLVFGGGWNHYQGKHFGEVIWAKYANALPNGYRYYENNATKTDLNFYAKGSADLSTKFTLSADLQYRNVWYSFLGYNQMLENVQQSVSLAFFNPKLALNYALGSKSRIFLSGSVGSREPVRDDYTQSTPASRPLPEKLYDYELGYRRGGRKTELAATAFYMFYENQLVLTGAINDVGAYTRTNIPKSYRAGIELEASWMALKSLKLSGNLALSRNKIISSYTEYLFDYESETEKSFIYSNSDLSFSPSVIASAIASYSLSKYLELSLVGKYVGEQFLDNTSSDLRKIDPFMVYNFRISLKPAPTLKPGMNFSLQINNLFNARYSSNGYTYSDMYGMQRNDYNYYFPQAGTHLLFMLRISID